ncbi:hypothetical protein EX30DRAFT_395725 [Ascodesmis nigricans]|uniref:Transcriptional regulator n=1 Tax=Ascodesmis nigricans TaxID=341454 RepID=A0A4S2MX13_9PEZI|nr:hypothetical protein EX30DRAFT_395725 [Ascodesmis nigricans]
MSRDEDADARIAAAIRVTIAREFKANPELITIKYIRTLAEKELGLEPEFFKTDPYWKSESKTLIQQEVQILENNAHTPSPPKKRVRTEKKPAARKAEDENAEGDEDPEPAKRGRKPKASKPTVKESPVKSSKMHDALPSGTDAENESEDKAPKKRKRPAPRKKVESPVKKEYDGDDSSILSDRDSDFETKLPQPSPKKSKVTPSASVEVRPSTPPPQTTGDDDFGDDPLSELEDNTPPRKRGPRKSKSKSKTPTSPSSKPVTKRAKKASEKVSDLNPSESKIKALQGQLVKCGVRRIWSKELAQYDTAAAKIRHLQNLLKEIGLEGQFSLSKAKKIKEERELRAEVEEIQQGAEEFSTRGTRATRKVDRRRQAVMDSEDEGDEDDEDEDEDGKPKRKLARGLAELDFLGDQSSDSD